MRARYSKYYKYEEELKKIRETCKAEDRRCLIILKEIILQAQAYATSLDETSRLQQILKSFEENIKS